MAARLLLPWLQNCLLMLIAKYVFAVAAALSLVSCGSRTSSDKTVLAVSIEPQRQVLEQIAGPGFEVITVLGRGSDPETFDPSTSQRMALDDADIYFATNVLPFEITLKKSLGANTSYIPTTGDTKLIYGNHGHSHEGSHEHHHDDLAVDPHYWSSFEGMDNIAAIMYDALTDKYPDRKAEFSSRYAQYTDSVATLRSVIKHTLDSATQRTFAVWHPSLSYFAREFGLEQLPLGVEGKDLSAKAIAEAIDHARADSVRVFFFQPGIDSRQAEVMSRGIGSKLVPVNLLDYNWQDQLKLIADEIARAQ